MKKSLQIKVEQIAFTSSYPAATKALLASLLGMDSWTEDEVTTTGSLFTEDDGFIRIENVANLSFNYAAGLEFEILKYKSGRNWLEERGKPIFGGNWPELSHIGMHCTAEELVEWMNRMAENGVNILQDVTTVQHTNPFLVDCGRKYRYVIFGTEELLGFDFKLIVRIPGPDEQAPPSQA